MMELKKTKLLLKKMLKIHLFPTPKKETKWVI
jgi:hypothetical protein